MRGCAASPRRLASCSDEYRRNEIPAFPLILMNPGILHLNVVYLHGPAGETDLNISKYSSICPLQENYVPKRMV
ncbi:MAG: hypothetical protein A4E38_01603 [Methanoregulaceae archaeon PtaB.Bin108]|nr:MAG: hypothetical protein A4E38_01603 [Methanoregulaceae archaeon PtaB.Bin108]